MINHATIHKMTVHISQREVENTLLAVGSELLAIKDMLTIAKHIFGTCLLIILVISCNYFAPKFQYLPHNIIAKDSKLLLTLFTVIFIHIEVAFRKGAWLNHLSSSL